MRQCTSCGNLVPKECCAVSDITKAMINQQMVDLLQDLSFTRNLLIKSPAPIMVGDYAGLTYLQVREQIEDTDQELQDRMDQLTEAVTKLKNQKPYKEVICGNCQQGDKHCIFTCDLANKPHCQVFKRLDQKGEVAKQQSQMQKKGEQLLKQWRGRR